MIYPYKVRVTVDFPTGIRKYSTVSHAVEGDGNYPGRILNVSGITAEVGEDGFNAQPFTISIDDKEQTLLDEMNASQPNRALLNRIVLIDFIDPLSFDSFRLIQSLVTNYYRKEYIFYIECNRIPTWLDQKYPQTTEVFSSVDYPGPMPPDPLPTDWKSSGLVEEAEGKTKPIYYGLMHSFGGEQAGAVECVRVKTEDNGDGTLRGTYFVSQGHCHLIAAAWDAGQPLTADQYMMYNNPLDGCCYVCYNYTVNEDVEYDIPPDYLYINLHGWIDESFNWIFNPADALKAFFHKYEIPYDSSSLATLRQTLLLQGYHVCFPLDQPFSVRDILIEFARNFFFYWYIGDDLKLYFTEIPAWSDPVEKEFGNRVIISANEDTNLTKPVNRVFYSGHYVIATNYAYIEGEKTDTQSIADFGENDQTLVFKLLIGENAEAYRFNILDMCTKYFSHYGFPSRGLAIKLPLEVYFRSGVSIGSVIKAYHDDIFIRGMTYVVVGETINSGNNESAVLKLRPLEW